MNGSPVLEKIHTFGRWGKRLAGFAIFCFAFTAVGAMVYTSQLFAVPTDAITITAEERAEMHYSSETDAVLRRLFDSFTSVDVEGYRQQTVKSIEEQDGNELARKTNLLGRDYDHAIYSVEDGVIGVSLRSDPIIYDFGVLRWAMVVESLTAVAYCVVFYLLRRVLAALEKCSSPFCMEIVDKLRSYGISLLPAMLLSSLGLSLMDMFTSGAARPELELPLDDLLLFVVVMCLVVIFRYGVKLQQESDETL